MRELFGDDGAFFVDHAVAHEAAGDEIILGAVREEVTGELFGEKLIVGQVAVEGIDDPIAIDPLVARFVFFETVGVGVAGNVEPVAAPFLAVGGTGQQVVDERVDGGGRIAGVGGEEGANLGGGWWQADDVQENPAHERPGARGGERGEIVCREAVVDPRIDGMLIREGEGRFLGHLPRPVLVVGGALFDPLAKEFGVFVGEVFFCVGRRHAFVAIPSRDAVDDFAFVGIAGNNRVLPKRSVKAPAGVSRRRSASRASSSGP